MDFTELIKQFLFFLKLIQIDTMTLYSLFNVICLIYKIIIHSYEFRKLYLVNMWTILEK